MRQILLLDDDELFSEFIRDAAELVEFSTTALDNGAAIKEQDLSQFDFVILDLTVPGTDGVQVLRYLHQQHYMGRVIIASGCERSVINSAHQLGQNYGLKMTKALSKPFPLDALLNILSEIEVTTDGQVARFSVNTNKIEKQSESLLPELKSAIENRQILAFYQPRFSLNTNKLVGVESLARWTLADGQQIPPSVFIKLAEEHNLIEPLTRCMVEQIFPQIAQWNRMGLIIHVSFNYSARTLHALDFPDYLADLAARHAVLPQHVIVELTESALADDVSALMEILTRIRMKGFSLSIDDFGTGYSSVQQLQTLPFNELKIDQSFVANFASRNHARTIIESTIEMAHKLGIRVVAEGIENQEVIDYLRQVGCDEGQGYFYAKPMSSEAFQKWIKANPSCIVELNPAEKSGFTIVALDDDVEFIELMSDVLNEEFNFYSFTNIHHFLSDFAKLNADIVLLDVNMPQMTGYEICQQIRENSEHDFSVIFISGADTQDQRLKAFAAGGDDFIAKPVSFGELLAKLRTIRRYQENKANLTEQEEMARNMAFQSMTEASQYGAILRFFKDSFTCKSYEKLVEMFFNLMDSLQLVACIQFRSKNSIISYRGIGQACSPMEDNLFEMLKNEGRLYHYKSRTMVNDKHVSVLVKNMPIEDEITYGRYNDLLAAIIEGLENKWVEILHDDSTDVLIKNMELILDSLSEKFTSYEKQTHEIIEMLILDVRASLHVLDLSEEQENYLISSIEKGIERVVELSDSGYDLSAEFSDVLNSFKEAYE
ncbi:EAL domain-containing protein [Catenovulum sediminis]|uniref:EAL domain-containing protein n=1 Tax=Catenovulum sediminis TaxID=1740262 RepID=A0ABV1RMV1_9ALTE